MSVCNISSGLEDSHRIQYTVLYINILGKLNFRLYCFHRLYVARKIRKNHLKLNQEFYLFQHRIYPITKCENVEPKQN